MTNQTDTSTGTPTVRPNGHINPDMVENDNVLTGEELKVLMKGGITNKKRFSDVAKMSVVKRFSEYD